MRVFRRLMPLVLLLFLCASLYAQDKKQTAEKDVKKEEKKTEKKNEQSEKDSQKQEAKDTKAISLKGSLPSTVVTATRTPEEATDIPQSTSKATREEIENRLPTQPIEAIQDEPGVFVQQTGAGGGTPIVRGLIGNRVLYLVDGIRINNGRLFGGPNPFFNQIDIGSVEEIEVLRGPGSVQYGSDAIGGIFHFKTKTLNLFPEKLEYGGKVSGQYRTVDQSRLGHLELYAAQKRVNLFIGGTLARTSDSQGGNSQGTIDFTSYKSRGLFGKAQFKVADGHVLTLAFLQNIRADVDRHDQSSRNQPSGLPRFSSPLEKRDLIYLRDEINDVSSVISRFEPYVYYQGVVRESEFTSESATQIRTDERASREKTVGFGALAATDFTDELRLVYGFDVRLEEFNDRTTRSTLTKATGAITTAERAPRQPDGRYDVEDVYAFLDWRPSESLRLTAGARYETAHINSTPEPLDVSAGFTENDLDLDERYQAITWSFGALFWLTDEFAFVGTVATGFRAPTYSDTLSRGPFTFGVNQPSPNVDPEETFSYDVGLRYDSDWLYAFATFYQTFVRDQLVGQPTGGFVDLDGNGMQDAGEAAFQRENTGTSRIYGIEAGGSLFVLSFESLFPENGSGLFSNVELFGSVAWTYGEDLEGSQPQRFIPPTNGVIGVRVRSGEPKSYLGWNLEFFARIVRRQARVSANDLRDPARARTPAQTFPSNGNPPLRSDFSVPGYTTLHLRFNISLTKNARVFISADNLTNKKYRQAYSRQDAPGFSLTTGAEINF